MNNLVIKLIKQDPLEIFRLIIKIILFFLPSFRQEDVYYRRRAKMLHFLSDYGLYEARYLKVLPDLVKAGAVVADIGANFGVYTKRLSALAGSEGKVLAFEPLQGAYANLTESCASLSNVQFFKVAISNISNKESEIRIPLLFDKIPEPALSTLGEVDCKYLIEKITLKKLDDYSDQLKGLSFIKVDIEGFEQEFFEGAIEVIKANRPTVQFEADKFKDRDRFLSEFCSQNNYKVMCLNSKSEFVGLDDPNGDQINLYLIPL